MIRLKVQKVHMTLFFSVVLLIVCAALSAQAFSHLLSFQGRLCDLDTGKPWPDGKYEVTFAIYDAETDGTRLWWEIQPAVEQKGGIFTVCLGTEKPFPADLFMGGDRWLALQVSGDQEMKTRYRIAPSAFAIYADDSNKVEGFHASSTPTPGHILPLDGAGKLPLGVIPQGPGSGLDADLLDGQHAGDFWTKDEGGPFVELDPFVAQTGAAVDLVGTGVIPAARMTNAGPALLAETTVDQMKWIWSHRCPSPSPGSRSGHAMVYDTSFLRGAVVLFGGLGGAGFLNDTWQYQCGWDSWSQMAVVGEPPVRRLHAMAYDSESLRTILFGGQNGEGSLGDTWMFDFYNSAWTDRDPVLAPSPRWGPAMAYDAKSDRVILFGGQDGSVYSDDTWEYDCDRNTWDPISPPPDRPSARSCSGMAYDAESDRIILFGGSGYPGGYMDDTWAYDCDSDTWEQKHPPISPKAVASPAMAYDSKRDLVILYGNPTGDRRTWAYNYNADTWTELSVDPGPLSLQQAALAYDPANDRLVLYGGWCQNMWGDTWVLGELDIAEAATFDGTVRISGNLLVEGEKNAVVATETFGERKVYCQESTEVWFEHIGRGKLQNGFASVTLDPVFLETVTVDSAHPMEVFITPYCPMGEYWVEPGQSGFTLRTESDAVIGEFGYRVVAKRRGYEDARLEPTERR